MNTIDGRYQQQRNSGLRYGIIEVTTRCQFRCPGCYMVERGMLGKTEMSFEQAVRVLDLCRDFCGQELETMDILGGEPLLWGGLEAYIDVLLSRSIKPWIFTNMTAITPERARWLFQRNVHITGKLNIANPKNEEQCKLQSEMIGANMVAVQTMVNAIRIFRQAGYRDPLFRLQNLVRRKNIHLVPGFIRYCRRRNIGVDLELMGSGEAVDERYYKIAPTTQEIADMIQTLDKQGEDCNLCQKKVDCREKPWPEFNNPAGRLLMPHLFGSCPFYDKGLYFATDGSIRACSNSTQILARVAEHGSIKKAWGSKLLSCRRELTQQNIGEPCHSCDRWEKCRGGCRATVEGMGDPFGGYTLCPLPLLRQE